MSSSPAARNVLITGASRGLGLAIAEAFAALGDNLFLVARSSADLQELADRLRARGGPAQAIHTFSADFSQDGAAERVVEHARETWQRLDVLVNNAATLGPIGPAWETPWPAWESALRVDLLAPVRLAQLCAAWMVPCRAGRIICVSGGGAASPRPNFSAYATAKAGLVRFCETLAQELAAFEIQVNAIAPGAMNTAMHQRVLDAGAGRAGQREFENAVEQARRGGVAPSRAAELCVFLASAAAAGISGRLISAVWDDWKSLPENGARLASSDIYTLRRIVPEDRGLKW